MNTIAVITNNKYEFKDEINLSKKINTKDIDPNIIDGRSFRYVDFELSILSKKLTSR